MIARTQGWVWIPSERGVWGGGPVETSRLGTAEDPGAARCLAEFRWPVRRVPNPQHLPFEPPRSARGHVQTPATGDPAPGLSPAVDFPCEMVRDALRFIVSPVVRGNCCRCPRIPGDGRRLAPGREGCWQFAIRTGREVLIPQLPGSFPPIAPQPVTEVQSAMVVRGLKTDGAAGCCSPVRVAVLHGPPVRSFEIE